MLRPLLMVLTRRDWRGAEHIPADGGFVAVVNHVSHVDPLTFAHFVYDNGRLPRFLGKEVLFRLFFVGRVLRGAKQIPVYRETGGRLEGLLGRRRGGRRRRVRRDLPGGARSPATRTCGRWSARPARPGSRWRPAPR